MLLLLQYVTTSERDVMSPFSILIMGESHTGGREERLVVFRLVHGGCGQGSAWTGAQVQSYQVRV